MKDLLLTDDGDLFISEETADASFTESQAQAVKIRLKWFLGEWRINTGYGFPWHDEFLGEAPNLDLLRSRVRETILSVDEVEAVKSLDVSFDRQTRKVYIAFNAKLYDGTKTGEVTVNV